MAAEALRTGVLPPTLHRRLAIPHEDETIRVGDPDGDSLDVPIHFTAFHPDYKVVDRPATPASTLTRARDNARAEGIRYVYTGNVHDTEGGTTRCPECDRALIVRDWHDIRAYRLTADGRCDGCGAAIPGSFGAGAGSFGRRRIPVRLRGMATA